MATWSHKLVNLWLRNLEDSQPLSPPHSDKISPQAARPQRAPLRKRARQLDTSQTTRQQEGRLQKRKRLGLREIHPNIAGMSQQGEGLPRRSKRLTDRQDSGETVAPQPDPMKKSKMVTNTPFEIAEDSEDEEEHFGALSRPASGLMRGEDLETAGPQLKPSTKSSLSTHYPSGKSTTSGSKSKSSRRSSPKKKTKTLARLRFNAEPVQYCQLSKKNCPAAASDLFTSIRRLAHGKGVLPLLPEAVLQDTTTNASGNEDFDDSFINDPGLYADTSPLRQAPDKRSVSNIIKRTAQARTLNLSEAHWNCYVHAPTLMLAHECSYHPDVTDHLNITTSLPFDDCCPESWVSGERDKRKIDFVMVLPEHALVGPKERFKVVPINATDEDGLLSWPITVLIETKIEGQQEALVQLGLWALAQSTHLRDALGEVPPIIPCLLIESARLQVFFAEPEIEFELDGSQQVERLRINMYGSVEVGSVDDEIGVYKVVAALALLFNWSATDYLPWIKARLAEVD